MGHKLSPKSLRTGTFLPWGSRWFSEKDYASFVAEDAKIRRFIAGKLSEAGLESVEIERSGTKVKVIISVSKPGLVIGRGGAGVEIIRESLAKVVSGQLELEVKEVKAPSTSAPILAQRIAQALERRGQYKRVINEVAEEAISRGAKGVKIELSGRLGGKEIARTEKVTRGSIPLSTLRANIVFSQSISKTRYGSIGVKVWVYLGEIEEE
ncbi:30S ribosomal protein S3 [candidate division WWE3 bacterium RIFCSPHIGHO2_01_FULL_48_15]|uniref:Small ribosomal subunit protein uS3 n=1 Tax=candidate division WWE3 bacterium RIFCSPHIGHO2_01_FULL_48_15 TaxID=1802619 RepID=A0A1F4V9S3_UNCKA|nr:MAG: 30S ribosomal protein S3 [candidate division WWE3 bacterium RIFCSPHIGHO2_01_FULL_48_15]